MQESMNSYNFKDLSQETCCAQMPLKQCVSLNSYSSLVTIDVRHLCTVLLVSQN